jgi:hypothetical protein
MTVVLVLIYSFAGYVDVRPQTNMESCAKEAPTHLGEAMNVIDPGFYQGGPPRVTAAFCAPGAVMKD